MPCGGRRRLLGLYLAQTPVFRLRLLSRSGTLARLDRHDRGGRPDRLAAAPLGAQAEPGGAALLRRLPDRVGRSPAWLDLAWPADRLDRSVGRRLRVAAGGRRRHGRVAAGWHPARARPAILDAGRARGVDRLHRIRARRAAHHRAFHGQHHAAVVRAGGVEPRSPVAPGDRRRAIRVGLHGGGRSGRPSGHAEGTETRPAWRWASAIGSACVSWCCRRH